MNPYLKKLTPRQLQFCLNYLSINYKSAKAAMIAAGYNKDYALRNSFNILKNTNIIAFLRHEMKRRAEEAAIRAIDFECEIKKRAFETADEELRQKYSVEARQWEKQRLEFDIKLKELEAKIKEVESDKKNEPININFKVV